MRRFWTVAAVALVAACGKERVETPSAALRPEVIEGEVAQWTGDELVVDEGATGGPLTVLGVDERTQWVGPGGEPLARESLREGLPVRVFYGTSGPETWLASRVEVTGSSAPNPSGIFAPPPDPLGPDAPSDTPDIPVEPEAPGDEALEPDQPRFGDPNEPDVKPDPLP